MHRRWAAGALGTLVWMAGCVAILDVDSEDYQDIDEAVCSCAESPTICEGYVQAILEVDGRRDVIQGCVQDSASCKDLDDCFVAGGICANEGGSCADGGDQLKLRCCEGTTCQQGKCAVAACSLIRQECGERCCAGLSCGDAGRCCRRESDACDDNLDCCGALTCKDSVCQPCGQANQQCEGGVADSTCCGKRPCVSGFCAAL